MPFKGGEKLSDYVIDIYGQIDSTAIDENIVTPQLIRRQLNEMKDAESIVVNINSNGGDVFSGVAIYNMLKRHPAKMIVNIDGIAASIASVIAMAGDVIYMPSNAVIMVHNAWSTMQGDSKQLRKQADALEKINNVIYNSYLSRKLNIKRDELQYLMDNETFLTAEEAKEIGFIDKITASQKSAAAIHNMIFGGEIMRYNNRFRNEDEEQQSQSSQPTAEDVIDLLEEILEVVKDTNAKVKGKDSEGDAKENEEPSNSFARLFNIYK